MKTRLVALESSLLGVARKLCKRNFGGMLAAERAKPGPLRTAMPTGGVPQRAGGTPRFLKDIGGEAGRVRSAAGR